MPASVNRLIYREHEREADGLAHLEKINFARLGKEFCSSEMTRSSSEVEEIVLKVFRLVTFSFLGVTFFYALKKIKKELKICLYGIPLHVACRFLFC